MYIGFNSSLVLHSLVALTVKMGCAVVLCLGVDREFQGADPGSTLGAEALPLVSINIKCMVMPEKSSLSTSVDVSL